MEISFELTPSVATTMDIKNHCVPEIEKKPVSSTLLIRCSTDRPRDKSTLAQCTNINVLLFFLAVWREVTVQAEQKDGMRDEE